MNGNQEKDVQPSKGRRKQRWLLAAGAAFASLCLVEVILRIFVPGLSIHRFDQNQQLFIETGNEAYRRALLQSDTLFWKFRPNVTIDGEDSRYFPGRISNSLGLRNEECTRKKAPGVFRILALGDSCTFGVGVPMDGCYPRRLEEILNQGRTDGDVRDPGCTFQVLNAGVPGYTSFQGLNYFLETGLTFEPDLLLICFGWNDAVVWDDRTDRFISQYLIGGEGGGPEALLSKSAIYRACKKALYSLKVSLQFGSRTPRVPLEAYIENMERILSEARSRGVEALFLLWPMQAQVDSKTAERTPHQEALRRFCNERRVPLVDLLEVFRKSGDASWFIDTGHVDARGYRLVAESVAESLVKHGLLPTKTGKARQGE
jgi:lysophospholipase L1-like esterase